MFTATMSTMQFWIFVSHFVHIGNSLETGFEHEPHDNGKDNIVKLIPRTEEGKRLLSKSMEDGVMKEQGWAGYFTRTES